MKPADREIDVLRQLVREVLIITSRKDDRHERQHRLLEQADGADLFYVDISGDIWSSYPDGNFYSYAGDKIDSIVTKTGRTAIIFFPSSGADKKSRVFYDGISTKFETIQLDDSDVAKAKEISISQIGGFSEDIRRDLKKLAGLKAPIRGEPLTITASGTKSRRTSRPEVKEMQALIGIPAADQDGIWGPKTEAAYERFVDSKEFALEGATVQNIKDDWKTWGPKITKVYEQPVSPAFTDDTNGVLQLLRMLRGKDRNTGASVEGQAAPAADEKPTTAVSTADTSVATPAAPAEKPTVTTSPMGVSSPGALGVQLLTDVPTQKGATAGKKQGGFTLQNVFKYSDGSYSLNKPQVQLDKKIPFGSKRDHLELKVIEGGDFILIPINPRLSEEKARPKHWSLLLLEADEPQAIQYVALSDVTWVYDGNFKTYGPGGVAEIVDVKYTISSVKPNIEGVTIARAVDRNTLKNSIISYIQSYDNPVGIPLYLTQNLNNKLNDFAVRLKSTF